MFDITDFIGLLCLLLLRVRYVIVNVRHILLCVCVLGSCFGVEDLLDPAPEAAHSGVERWRGGGGAAVTSSDDPSEDPTPGLLLAHQPSAGVTLTVVAVEEAGVGRAAGAQRAVAGEAVTIALFTLPGGHERDPGGEDGVCSCPSRSYHDNT